jgi:hypothetical protein
MEQEAPLLPIHLIKTVELYILMDITLLRKFLQLPTYRTVSSERMKAEVIKMEAPSMSRVF